VPVTGRAITFRPLQASDLPRLVDWLNEPHVFAWWGEPASPGGLGGTGEHAATLDAVQAEYGPAIDGPGSTRHFVIVIDEAPVGLIQWYRLRDEPRYAAEIGELDGAGVDLLIGDPGHVGRGLGAAVIDAFVTGVVFAQAGVDRCVAGPDVRNTRSIGAFAKAGFRPVRDAAVSGEPEPERVMVRDRHPTGRPAGPAPIRRRQRGDGRRPRRRPGPAAGCGCRVPRP
jgi:aminoglycoside 6'-N-acetyltransferase